MRQQQETTERKPASPANRQKPIRTLSAALLATSFRSPDIKRLSGILLLVVNVGAPSISKARTIEEAFEAPPAR